MDKTQFGTFLRQKRTERSLTQKDLADALCLDVTAVSKWERGINYPDITMIPALCQALGISEHELIVSGNDTETRARNADARHFRRLRNGVFYGFTIAYALALLVCFIVNLATVGTLSWFFLVASGCLCGFCFVPSFARFTDNAKLAVYSLTPLGSLLLLYLTCCLSAAQSWGWAAGIGTVLGYFALLYPILFTRQKRHLSESSYTRLHRFFLLQYTVGLGLLSALLVLITAPVPGLPITCYCFTLPIAVGLVRLLPVRRLRRLSLDFALGSAYAYGLNPVLNRLITGTADGCLAVDFADWVSCSDGNTALLLAVSLLLTAAVLFALSFRKTHSRTL